MSQNISPHKLRHFLFTWLKKKGIDDALIQPYSGHETRKSLEVYSKLSLSEAQNVPSSLMFISVITILEIETGILLLTRKKQIQGNILRNWMDRYVLPSFKGRILDITLDAVFRCATLRVLNPLSDRDALIASTALVHGMAVVTRNIDDFRNTSVTLINPWL